MCEMHAWSSIEVPPEVVVRPCKICESESPNEIVQRMISNMPGPKGPPPAPHISKVSIPVQTPPPAAPSKPTPEVPAVKQEPKKPN